MRKFGKTTKMVSVRHIAILLLIILTLIVTTTEVYAADSDYCCFVGAEGESSLMGFTCLDGGEPLVYSPQEDLTESVCVQSLQGTWKPATEWVISNPGDACGYYRTDDTDNLCVEGCCCMPNDNSAYTAKFACQEDTEGTTFIPYSKQFVDEDVDCSQVCNPQVTSTYTLTLKLTKDNGEDFETGATSIKIEPSGRSFSPDPDPLNLAEVTQVIDSLADGSYRIRIQSGDCSGGNSIRIAGEDVEAEMELVCPTPSELCQNGVLDEGEECDFDSDNNPIFGDGIDSCDDVNSRYYQLIPGLPENSVKPTIGCSDNCKYDLSQCVICESNWVNCDYSNQEQLCGEVTNCVDENACAIENPVKPTFIPCTGPPIGQDLCGNGEIDYSYGEECDGTELGEKTCQDFGFLNGNLKCTSDCRFDQSECDYCPSVATQTTCTPQACSECQNCIDSGNCQETCDFTNNMFQPTINSIQGEACSLTAEINSEITIDDSDYNHCLGRISEYKIIKTREGIETEIIPKQETTSNNNNLATFSYTDADIQPDTTYEYQVKVTYSYGGVIYEQESTPTTFTTGDSRCYDPATCEIGFCDGTSISSCGRNQDNLNTILQTTDCNEEGGNDNVCIDNADGALCTKTNICNRCNGLFGIFSYMDNAIETEDGWEYCKDKHLIDDYYCFEEQTKTGINQYEECQSITSCYDYRSEESCQADQCLVFEKNTGNNFVCEWKETNFGLGIGVCRPSVLDEQDCSKCGLTDDYAYTCTKELCELHGDCYFSERTNENNKFLGRCLGEEKISCDDYTTKSSCQGDDTEYSKVQIDLNYGTYNNGNEFERLTGTNELTSHSDDRFKLEVCQWIEEENKCIKNSDGLLNNNKDDCEIDNKASDNKVSKDLFNNVRTTRGNNFERACKQDVTPPTTTVTLRDTTLQGLGNLSVYGVGDELQIDYVTTDNEFTESEEGIITRFRLINKADLSDNELPEGTLYNSENKKFYPKQTLEELQTSSINDNLESGEYILTYYSEDASRNLEEIKAEIIMIDSTTPEYDMNTKIDSYEVQRDGREFWRSDLKILFNASDNQKMKECTLKLKSTGQGEITPTSTDQINSENEKEMDYTLEYTFLEDDNYQLEIECKDIFNNILTAEEGITIEADKSIIKPTPRYEVFNGREQSIEIKIYTENTAKCSYEIINENASGETEYEYTYENLFTDIPNPTFFPEYGANFYEHTATISVEKSIINKVTYIMTKCEFTDENGDSTGKVTKDNYADMIIFSVDATPPKAKLLYQNQERLYEPTFYEDQALLKIDCDVKDDDLLAFSVNDNEEVVEEKMYFEQSTTNYFFSEMNPEELNNICLTEKTETCGDGITRDPDGIFPEKGTMTRGLMNSIIESSSFNELMLDWNSEEETQHFWGFGQTTPYELTPELLSGRTYLYYTCEDEGENQDLWHYQELLIKNTAFKFKSAEICSVVNGELICI